MWCPPDFHHIHEVETACETAARELVPWERGKEFVWIENESHDIDHEKSNESRRLVTQGLLFEIFINEYPWNSFACSASGQVLRLSRHIVRPIFFNHWNRYTEHFARHFALLYVDARSGKIDPQGTAARIRGASIDEGDTDHSEAWQNFAIQDFGELSGWTVCYPRSEVDLSSSRLIELWNVKYPKDSSTKRGRPREREKVKAAYQKVFPNGHGPLTQKEILRELAKQGQHTSIDTLRRALQSDD